MPQTNPRFPFRYTQGSLRDLSRLPSIRNCCRGRTARRYSDGVVRICLPCHISIARHIDVFIFDDRTRCETDRYVPQGIARGVIGGG